MNNGRRSDENVKAIVSALCLAISLLSALAADVTRTLNVAFDPHQQP
jgi:hypothetical protein